jgi:hypothetical protein
MASWVLICRNCSNEFHHSKVDDYKIWDFLNPTKPSLPGSDALGRFLQAEFASQTRRKRVPQVVALAKAHTSGNKVRVRSGDFILNVDEKQVAKNDWGLSSNIPYRIHGIHRACLVSDIY